MRPGLRQNYYKETISFWLDITFLSCRKRPRLQQNYNKETIPFL